MRGTEKEEISVPTSSSRTICCLLNIPLIALFIRVHRSRDGEPHGEPRPTTDPPSVQGKGKERLFFSSEAKSLLVVLCALVLCCSGSSGFKPLSGALGSPIIFTCAGSLYKLVFRSAYV